MTCHFRSQIAAMPNWAETQEGRGFRADFVLLSRGSNRLIAR